MQAWRRTKVVAISAVTVTLAGVATAAGLGVFREEGPDPRDQPSGMAAERILQDPAQVVADPESGRPWGLQRFRSTDGRECVRVGRIVGGRVQSVAGSRTGRLGASAPAACRRGGQDLVFTAQRYPGQTSRTVVLGIAADPFARILIRTSSRDESLRSGRNGEFLAVYRNIAPRPGLSVRRAPN